MADVYIEGHPDFTAAGGKKIDGEQETVGGQTVFRQRVRVAPAQGIGGAGENADIDTSAEQLTTSSVPAKFGVRVLADITNSGIVYVGPSGVTADSADATDGFPLYPGDSLFLPVENANLVYVIASTNNQKARWIAV